MTKNNLFYFLILSVMISGCSGFCIKIDGKYQGKQGSIEYCYEPAKGILKSATDKAVIVTEEQLQQIKSEYEQPTSKQVSEKLIDKLIKELK